MIVISPAAIGIICEQTTAQLKVQFAPGNSKHILSFHVSKILPSAVVMTHLILKLSPSTQGLEAASLFSF